MIQVLQDKVKSKSQNVSSLPAENRLVCRVLRTRTFHLDLDEVDSLAFNERELLSRAGILDIATSTPKCHQVSPTHDSPDTENGHIDIQVIHREDVVLAANLNV